MDANRILTALTLFISLVSFPLLSQINNIQAANEERLEREVRVDLHYELLNGGSILSERHFTLAGNSLTIDIPEKLVTVNGRQVRYFFSHWSDGDVANPRTWRPGDNLQVTAVMKGHMVSNSGNATAANNGKHILIDKNGNPHIIYSDQGGIYHTLSDNDGQDWVLENRLNPASEMGYNPSIFSAIGSGPATVGVIWEKDINGKRQAVFRLQDQQPQGKWSNETIVAEGLLSPTPNAIRPVALLLNGYDSASLFLVTRARERLSGKSGLFLLHYEINGAARQPRLKNSLHLPGTNAASAFPTMTSAFNGTPGPLNGNTALHIAWEQPDHMQSHIHYVQVNSTANELIPGMVEYVSVTPMCFDANTCTYRLNKRPAITIDLDNNIHLVWRAFRNDNAQNVIVHRRRRQESTWYDYRNYFSDIFESNSTISDPAIGTYVENGRPVVQVAYPLYPNAIAIQEVRDRQWQTVANSYSGFFPSLTNQQDRVGLSARPSYLVMIDTRGGQPYRILFGSPQDNPGVGGKVAATSPQKAGETNNPAGLPEQPGLFKNYPNPFNPKTNIRYQLSDAGPVTLTIYDALGRKVRTLVNKNQAPGSYQVSWDGRTSGNVPAASGIYIYQLQTPSFVKSYKMILLK